MTRATKGARILNVDDNEIGRYTKTRILQQAGFEVIEAKNGGDALELVRSGRPQLVLLDLQLPDMNGFEVCRRIKDDPLTTRIPVLHITATGKRDAQTEATSLESGADIFLAQPVEPQELVTVVRTLLRLRTSELGLAESEERMRLATEGAGIATWEIDLRDNSAYMSPQLYRLLGYDTAEGIDATWDIWRSQIHREDRRAVLAAMQRARKHGELFTHEHRVVRRDDGAERWLAPYGRIHADETGAATRFMGVVVDITSRKHAEAYREELLRLEQAARTQAENLARLKDEFLATLSHELRSPMSAILGWLHLMKSGRLGSEQYAQAIDTIERNARLQNQLINDLLDVSSVIAGKLELKREPVLMTEVIERAVNSVRISIDAKQIRLACEVEPIGPLHYDAGRMQQVFVNLLSNAIKFTPEGGAIEIRGRRVRDRYEVSIRDDGEGIPPAVLPHLFERFRQADGSITRRHGGLGLGLAIVRHLVELHGGSVSAESDGPGAGATFTISLPAISDPAAVVPIVRGGSSAAARKRGRNALKGLRILIADDDPSARGLIEQVLASEGAEVMSATNSDEAIAICTRWKPALLVFDIGMPGQDGYALLQQVRERCPEASPAIAITGYAHAEDRERALAAGFAAHVAKPFNIDDVVELVTALARPGS